MNAPPDTPLVPGISPQVYRAADFKRIADLVRDEAGIVLNEKKQMLAYSRIAPLVRASGLQTFEEYLDAIDSDDAARTRTIASLTTNHTYFNREPHHFEHFAAEVRPRLIEEANAGQKVRIWSAGSSSGEEIYSLLMVLLGENRQEGMQLSKRQFIVLASDLADHAVKAASEGIYPAEAISKMPERLRINWTEASPDGDPSKLTISSHIKRMVRFRQLNLLRPWPFQNQFDVIFCRNVMIYFDEATKAQLVTNFARQLKPGGFLYIGHSERVPPQASQYLESVGSTIYRRTAA